jgi:peroxiredoxin
MARPGMKVGENEHNVQGDMLEVGAQAPDFILIANDLSQRSLGDYDGKVKVYQRDSFD